MVSQFLVFLLTDITADKVKSAANNPKPIIDCFTRLSLFVKAFDESQSKELLTNLFLQVFPIIESLASQCGSDQFLMDSMSIFVRNTVAFNGFCLDNHVEALVKFVIFSFRLYQNPELLNLARFITREFMKRDHGSLITQMIAEISQIITTQLGYSVQSSNNSTIWERYFHLMSCYLEVCPLHQIQSALVFKAIECSLHLISFRDSNLQREIFVFLKISFEENLMQACMSQMTSILDQLIIQIFNGFAFVYARFLMSPISDLFLRYFVINCKILQVQ